jgi:hypothetical protein
MESPTKNKNKIPKTQNEREKNTQTQRRRNSSISQETLADDFQGAAAHRKRLATRFLSTAAPIHTLLLLLLLSLCIIVIEMFFEKRGKKKKRKNSHNKRRRRRRRKEGRKEGIVERRRRRGPVRARWVVVAETLRHKSVHGKQRENEGAKNKHTHTKPNNGSRRRRNLLLTNHSTHAFCARKSK